MGNFNDATRPEMSESDRLLNELEFWELNPLSATDEDHARRIERERQSVLDRLNAIRIEEMGRAA